MCGPTELSPPPAYFETRIAMFDLLMQKYKDELSKKVRVPITVTLPDGTEKQGKAYETTPFHVAEEISKGLAKNVLVAEVNGELWDLDRPLEGNSSLKLLTWEDEKGREVFFHSSAHILGECLERNKGGCLCHGPPLEEGFFYDIDLEGRTCLESDFGGISETATKIVRENQKFERLEMAISDLREMFQYNKYKQRFLDKIDTPTTTVYRCGPLIDLCRGPHIQSTKLVKAFKVIRSNQVYFGGDVTAETLTRVYGVAFPDAKRMKEYEKRIELAAQANHHKIGKEQELFFFSDYSPGSCFFLPHGAIIYNRLVELIRKEYRDRGYKEVVTPNIFNTDLWVKSGHMKHYSDDMFVIRKDRHTDGPLKGQEKESAPQFALKPMNCPAHFLLFGHRIRSHKELPLRIADFGVLHRNEASGALSGLTRVRRFQQDDAHIFCREDQLTEEVDNVIDFLNKIYSHFHFTFSMALSTRPEKFMGEIELWNKAEEQLKVSLAKVGKFKINEGDGAFYGPKIDVEIRDAMNRPFQCGTIQIDFQGPINFDLSYQTGASTEGDAAGEGLLKRPVVIHRAILGSVERMFAILTENFVGKWPFWLSPRQAIVIPVGKDFMDYAVVVQEKIHKAGFECDVDLSGDTLSKKVARAKVYNFTLVVGANEQTNTTVAVRVGKEDFGEKKVDDFIANCVVLRDTFEKENIWKL